MSSTPDMPLEITFKVRDTCLCHRAQRTARTLARRFDLAFRPLGITNHQFSLLMGLSSPQTWTISSLATLLGVDRTTLTAALKPLQRRGLVAVAGAAGDARRRVLRLTDDGRNLLSRAAPIWAREHAVLEELLGGESDKVRDGLDRLMAT